ncbi:MAG: redoxin domain-containing protein [Phycisphaeraceae bacterium]|nr:redoxin domain-containing protein [Phycisphaeraceae bacterium]
MNRLIPLLMLPVFFGPFSFADPPVVNQTGPDLQAQTAEGEKVKLSEAVQAGPVVLIFMRGDIGRQCPLCTQQMQGLLKRAEELNKKKATIWMVYPGPKPAKKLKAMAEDFLKNTRLPDHFKLLIDPGFEIVKAYGVRWEEPKETAYPSTFVLGRKRKVHWSKISRTHGGRATAEQILKALPAP